MAPDAEPCIGSGNLASHLEALARQGGWHDRIAFHINDSSFTFAEVYAGARRAAAGLAERGVDAESRVLIALPEGIELIWTVLGALRLGAVAMPLDSAMRNLRASALEAAARSAEFTVSARHGGARLPAGTAIHVEELTGPGPRLDRCAELSQRSLAYASLVTRGTRQPQWAFHTHGDPLLFDQAMGGMLEPIPGGVTLTRSGMHTAFGFGTAVLLPLLRGSTTVLCDRAATAADVLGLIRRHNAAVLIGPPAFYSRLLDTPDRECLSTLRTAVVGTDVMGYPLELRLREEFEDRLLQVVATAELGHAVWAQTPGSPAQCARGKALPPYRARIVDFQGHEVRVGVEGLLEIADTSVEERPTDERVPSPRRPGELWHRTGHTATADEDGSIWIHGPSPFAAAAAQPKSVQPSVVERLLAQHPAVQEAAVEVQEHATGPRLRACVALHHQGTGSTALELLRLALLRTVHRQLGPSHVPRDIVFVRGLSVDSPDLPRSMTQQILLPHPSWNLTQAADSSAAVR